MNIAQFCRPLLAGLVFCVTAAAQDRMNAEIPFDFKVGAIHLANGRYTVERYRIGASYALELTNLRTGSRFHVLLQPAESKRSDAPRIEFFCEDGTCDLHSVSIQPSESWTIRVPMTRAGSHARMQSVALQPHGIAAAISLRTGIR